MTDPATPQPLPGIELAGGFRAIFFHDTQEVALLSPQLPDGGVFIAYLPHAILRHQVNVEMTAMKVSRAELEIIAHENPDIMPVDTPEAPISLFRPDKVTQGDPQTAQPDFTVKAIDGSPINPADKVTQAESDATAAESMPQADIVPDDMVKGSDLPSLA